MTQPITLARQVTAFLVSSIVSLGVLANASSRLYTENNPELAIAINPSNPDARIRTVELAFENEEDKPDFDELKTIIEDGIRFEAYDARLYSLLGIISELAGDPLGTAQDFYEHALVLNHTDKGGLLRRFAYNASQGRTKEALEQAELIFRAWPRSWELIEPTLPALLAAEEGYKQAFERFSTLPGGPRSMLISLAKSDAGLAIAKNLLIDWHNDGAEELRPAINTITSRLVGSDQPLQAFLLFGLTLNELERKEAGYVFNPRFTLEPNGSLFDWQLPRVAGISAQIFNHDDSELLQSSSGAAASTPGYLEIKFLNTPARLSSVLQTTRLPAGRFEWSISYSTKQIKGPKPVELLLRCTKGRKNIETIMLSSTDGEVQTISVPLTVPNSNCELQQIVVSNGNLVESWQNRYSGSISLHELQLQLSGS